MDANGLSVFDGSIAAYSDSSNTIYGTENKFLEPDLDKNQVGIENIIPYFYTYDDYNSNGICNSRWVAKEGHIFNYEKSEEGEKYNVSSIAFNKGLHFSNKLFSEKFENYKETEATVYHGSKEASLTLLPNCFNYTGTKLGINMTENDLLLADINIRGSIGFPN
jgi:hypothetical protein